MKSLFLKSQLYIVRYPSTYSANPPTPPRSCPLPPSSLYCCGDIPVPLEEVATIDPGCSIIITGQLWGSQRKIKLHLVRLKIVITVIEKWGLGLRNQGIGEMKLVTPLLMH